nr:leucyl aminopeptidase family protein [Nocardioides perillae]
MPDQVQPPTVELRADALVAAARASRAEVVAVPVLPGAAGEGEDGAAVLLGPGADELGELLGLDLLELAERQRATGAVGEVLSVPVAPTEAAALPALATLLLVGVGEAGPRDLRRAGAALARAVQDRDAVATTLGALAGSGGLEPLVAGTVLASFAFHWRSQGPEHRPVARVVLAGVPDAATRGDELDRAVAVARASWTARHLATVPSNLKNPPWLAAEAERAAAEAGLEFTVWDEQRLAAEGFGGIVGVGQASATPPRLVRLDYTPAGRGGKKAPRVVLVGKGITFDSGGLSLKPGDSMVSMKRDMTGGAVVIATMAALAAVGCPVRVTGLVAAAENAVSGNALRPGDVLRHYGGRTSEVTNTDAEGRLVMADALAYAVEQLDPAALVDVATLTGAVKVALGLRTGGLFADHDGLATALVAAGEAAGEPLWRLPLVADYEEKLASKVADADNAAGGAGAITAALFLQHFTGDVPWAHLDIASVGDSPDHRHEWTPGPTGFGVRALLGWLGSEDPLASVR